MDHVLLEDGCPRCGGGGVHFVFTYEVDRSIAISVIPLVVPLSPDLETVSFE